MRALLDVTDNLVDGEVVHPPDTRVLDGDDTYLVVAADKGTATFSDTANAVSEDYGFWLGDAFASGGSSGYDHKKLGITARGAWESVKRHFLELELDVAKDPFTVVGIGDMSGDVFGNGMLLSDRIRLVAAYDHRHIFIDPDPDPDVSFEERKRLFGLAGSSWNDYDRAKISEGGGVWPRTAKWIPLSESVQRALGVEDDSIAPNDLIRDILRAPVDLLWNGGIGTVVKASDETDEAAQDRSSDAIRVDANELRCRVVGEGGNLGLTRRARVEFARGGGRINADFIDNSAGVDCSDHEVNLKVLLGLDSELSRPDRDALLRDVEEDVVEHVLYDSFLQAQIIAQETRRSASRLDAYEDLMVGLEEDGLLDRASEALPSGEELAERRRAGRGMERPELSLLLTYAKRRVKLSLLESSLLDDPWLQRDLRGYFPQPVVERFGALLAEHPLRRELLATINANLAVNALGPVFVSQIMAERGVRPAEVVKAYRIAREVVGAEADWEAIEELEGKVEPEVQAELMGRVDMLVDAITRWYLVEGAPGDLASTIEAGREGFLELAEAAPGIGGEELQEARREVAERFVAAGVPEDMAQHALAAARARPRAGGRGGGPRHGPLGGGRGARVRGDRRAAAAERARGGARRAARVPADGALGAPGRARGRPPRALGHRGARARGPAGRRPGGGARRVPGRPQRGVPAPRGVHAHALARGRDRPGGVGAGGTAAARTGRVGAAGYSSSSPPSRMSSATRCLNGSSFSYSSSGASASSGSEDPSSHGAASTAVFQATSSGSESFCAAAAVGSGSAAGLTASR